MEPALQDLLDPSSGTTLADYLGSLPPQERDQALRDLVEKKAEVHDALKRVMDEKRRQYRETRGPECGGTKPDKAAAVARDLVRLSDQGAAFMSRYPPSATLAFTDEQKVACKEVLGTLDVLATWIRVRVLDDQPAAAGSRAETGDLVGV
jgi:hypothetical protein